MRFFYSLGHVGIILLGESGKIFSAASLMFRATDFPVNPDRLMER
jgi:hypothetical protein